MFARNPTSGTDLGVSLRLRVARPPDGGGCTTRWGSAMASDSQYPDDWDSRRIAILHRDGQRCQNCGDSRPRPELHVHHKEPVSEGGDHKLENLELWCADCHAEEHGARPCAFCFLIGHFVLDEVKRHGSVGLLHVCREHHQRLIRRAENWEAGDSGGDYTSGNAGVCAVCRDEASGRYIVSDRARRGELDEALICSQCRIDAVNSEGGHNPPRRKLQQRFERAGGSDA